MVGCDKQMGDFPTSGHPPFLHFLMSKILGVFIFSKLGFKSFNNRTEFDLAVAFDIRVRSPPALKSLDHRYKHLVPIFFLETHI